MTITFQRYCVAGALLVLLAAACTTDDDDPGVEGDDGATASTGSNNASSDTSSSSDTTGSGGTSSDSTSNDTTSATSGGGTSSTGTKCARPITLSSSTPLIADFDGYDGATAIGEWSFPLGGDQSVGVLAGTFVYGDDHLEGDQDVPETAGMVDGNDSTYALSIADTEADEYGGGMGLWMSECVDASTFDGISLWVRGNAPAGEAKLTLLMEETTPIADDGTCDGTTDEGCVQPSVLFPVTDEWKQIELSWADFDPGDSNGTAVTPDGHNIWQIQFDIGLEWTDEDGDEVYEPTPAPYELVVDDITFY